MGLRPVYHHVLPTVADSFEMGVLNSTSFPVPMCLYQWEHVVMDLKDEERVDKFPYTNEVSHPAEFL